MTPKTDALLKEYSELRGNGDPAFDYDHLKSIFKASSKKEQKEYISEMERYLRAIRDGDVSRGEPLIMKVVNDAINNED